MPEFQTERVLIDLTDRRGGGSVEAVGAVGVFRESAQFVLCIVRQVQGHHFRGAGRIGERDQAVQKRLINLRNLNGRQQSAVARQSHFDGVRPAEADRFVPCAEIFHGLFLLYIPLAPLKKEELGA